MPLLSVNLDDAADCRRGMKLIRQALRAGEAGDGCVKRPSRGRRGKLARVGGGPELAPTDEAAQPVEMSLGKKLAIIKQRGVWRHLVAIAREGDTPKSLPEWDTLLDLPRNKMRSLKAIFAKLENRWDVRFMRVSEKAGADESGNPRYIMPVRIRNQILSLAD
jgi:hypothetical protein